ncbi:hypothetical protein OB2597_09909 [Pseudooceanicola batsensis HTCC2597]|uniref:Uncharacterized protein n=1 Tax=Pseudooceanicola batsensis (strain ATCC BAA-863 / DSM 15984 / KCTC 12145 / HTCC2597) TaxID=252305 RepID=A3TVA4_PSEBH|nr:hypothetical protein [Pseudooceanicola batsensis]EAQ04450.1 hypothetical protein OB2597_09909 [Pseudooceanicola batsensis HTCC2597]
MIDKTDTQPTPVGVYDRQAEDRLSPAEVIALVLSVLWLAGAGAFFFVMRNAPAEATGYDPLTFVMVLLGVFLPVGMFWVAASATRSTRVIRQESRRIQAAIEAIRDSHLADAQGGEGGGDSITRKLDEIAAAQRKTETALATFHTTRTIAAAQTGPDDPPAVEEEEQADLPLDTVEEVATAPLPRTTFIRALNFPETAEDEVGFAALRQVLKDRPTANLIQAAQDVLTLLSQDGIFMDDLRPDMARPEIWRRFAQGERGRVVAALGGIRDRSSLALTAGRMRQDPVFRDAAHHFLRRFDQMFVAFEETATDQEITALSETRTSRAFMLLGRVAGIFN